MRKALLAVSTLLITFYIGLTLGEEGASFNLVSSPSTAWMKTGTGTTFKMTRVDDPEKNVSCYIMDVGPREHLACVKRD